MYSSCGYPAGLMFLKNPNQRQHRHHHELFLPSRRYRGEPPTVAGFLLYPDTPAKMKTTSQEAFSARPLPQQPKGVDVTRASQQGPNQSRSTFSEQGVELGKGEQGKEEGKHDEVHAMAVKVDGETLQMQSQYKKDFLPPSSCHGRRTPALPQPDNIGINPAFRFEFRTVHKQDFPRWSGINPGCAIRLRATRKVKSASEF